MAADKLISTACGEKEEQQQRDSYGAHSVTYTHAVKNATAAAHAHDNVRTSTYNTKGDSARTEPSKKTSTNNCEHKHGIHYLVACWATKLFLSNIIRTERSARATRAKYINVLRKAHNLNGLLRNAPPQPPAAIHATLMFLPFFLLAVMKTGF